jgi:hypothetical protein
MCLKNETRGDAERDPRHLISAARLAVSEKTRRERLLRHLESADKRTGWNGLGTAHHIDSCHSFTVLPGCWLIDCRDHLGCESRTKVSFG